LARREDGMQERRILIAGIGNIFFADDGFGVEVAQRLAGCNLPDEAHVRDFGIRCFDLAYALLEGYAASILVDTVQRGGEPGTVYLIELDLEEIDALEGQELETHGMSPVTVLRLVKALGGRPRRLLVVGCEPEVLGTDEEWQMGLSATVEAAIPEAIALIETVVAELLDAGPAAEACGTTLETAALAPAVSPETIL
jgi:hydrogenase maturation protease